MLRILLKALGFNTSKKSVIPRSKYFSLKIDINHTYLSNVIFLKNTIANQKI